MTVPRSSNISVGTTLKPDWPGVEITYNYGRDYLTNVNTRRACKCDKCRKKRADARAKARAKGR